MQVAKHSLCGGSTDHVSQDGHLQLEIMDQFLGRRVNQMCEHELGWSVREQTLFRGGKVTQWLCLVPSPAHAYLVWHCLHTLRALKALGGNAVHFASPCAYWQHATDARGYQSRQSLCSPGQIWLKITHTLLNYWMWIPKSLGECSPVQQQL